MLSHYLWKLTWYLHSVSSDFEVAAFSTCPLCSEPYRFFPWFYFTKFSISETVLWSFSILKLFCLKGAVNLCPAEQLFEAFHNYF